MADLGSRANVDIAINNLLNDLQPNGAILPSLHNGLIIDILDTLSSGIENTLRTNDTTNGEHIKFNFGSKIKFVQAYTGTLDFSAMNGNRDILFPNASGTVALLSNIPSSVSNNLFTADLTLANDRNHQLDNFDFKLSYNSSIIGREGNFKFGDGGFYVFCKKTATPSDYISYSLSESALNCEVAGTLLPSGTTFTITNGICSLGNGNNAFSFDAVSQETKISGVNGSLIIGNTTTPTNTVYQDLSTNKYGILYKGFGETTEIDPTGANYSSLVGTSLVPKKYVDDAISGVSASNISNADLTQTDLNRVYTRSAISGISRLRFQGTSQVLTLEDSANLEMYSGKFNDVGAVPLITLDNNKLSFNGGGCVVQGVGAEMFIYGQFGTTNQTKIQMGANMVIEAKSNRHITLKTGTLYFNNQTSGVGSIKSDIFIWGSSLNAIATEKFSIQVDSLFKGSSNSNTVDIFSVLNGNSSSNEALIIRGDGSIKMGLLPTLSTGALFGNIWSQNGVLRYGNASTNQSFTNNSPSSLTIDVDVFREVIIESQGNAITINNPTGTAISNFQELTFRIKDDGLSGTGYGITWGSSFLDFTGILPTTTTQGKKIYVGCKYCLQTGNWDVVACQIQP